MHKAESGNSYSFNLEFFSNFFFDTIRLPSQRGVGRCVGVFTPTEGPLKTVAQIKTPKLMENPIKIRKNRTMSPLGVK